MILGNDYVDLAPLFSAHSTRNYLLSTLDFTDSVGVTSHKVAVSQLVESNESLFNKETSRFSSEHNVTKREQGKEWLIEIPYFLREDVIRPSDVQGKRKPGTDFQETLTDIYAEYVAKHNVAFQRTKESVLAASLFSGKTYTPKTDDVLIEWGKLFNVSAMKATVNASSTDTTKIFKEFDQIATDIIEKAQSQAAAVAVPKFAKGSNVYQNIYGAASSTFELINAAPTEVYSYSYESSRGDAVNVVTENSQMVVNHGVGFSVQITVK